ncbi:MAG: glycosyltransferase family 4 protein [Verrucomicrobiales bacterium]
MGESEEELRSGPAGIAGVEPAPGGNRAFTYDVTVSVWQGFHVEPLAKGLIEAGFSVLGLGTKRRAFSSTRYRLCMRSAVLTQMAFRVPRLRPWLMGKALDSFESFARTHAGSSRIFWGWCNHHLSALEKAKAAGATIVVESGSSHAEWQRDRMREEYRRRGWTDTSSIDKNRIAKAVREYAIADRICVPSGFVRDTFLERGVAQEKLVMNPYGADAEIWREVAEARAAKSPDGPFTFVFTGSVMLRKGVAHLLRAWEVLGDDEAELWLVGGVHPDCREMLASLPRGVRVFGFQPWRELVDLYRRADVYVLPSLEEGMARSVLEAMAAGLPVIVTWETGTTDVMVDGEDGWVVRAADAEALAQAMGEAIDCRDRLGEMGASACARMQKFSWDAYSERTATMARGLLD